MKDNFLPEAKELFKRNEIYPKKTWGQNFLISQDVVERVVKHSNLSKEDEILEIGAGTGTITGEVSREVKRVVAVEKDKRLIPLLKKSLEDRKNVELINEDILKINISSFFKKDYKVISNLPYYIATPIVKKLIKEEEKKPLSMILILQKEIAERISAKAPNMNFLAVITQVFCKVETVKLISKDCFWPKPKVSSAIVKITPYKKPLISPSFYDRFFKVVEFGFLHPRKKLINNLFQLDNSFKTKVESKEKLKIILKEVNIDHDLRAENLTLCDWVRLVKKINEKQY